MLAQHIYIRRTRAVVQATHSVTHTKSYQVIHQLIGTNNVHILRETARAEKAEPAPAPQLYHSAHPTPPRTFCHILARSPPRPAPRIPAHGGPQPGPYRIGLARSPHRPATNKKSSPRGPTGCGPPRATCGPKPAPHRALVVT